MSILEMIIDLSPTYLSPCLCIIVLQFYLYYLLELAQKLYLLKLVTFVERTVKDIFFKNYKIFRIVMERKLSSGFCRIFTVAFDRLF